MKRPARTLAIALATLLGLALVSGAFAVYSRYGSGTVASSVPRSGEPDAGVGDGPGASAAKFLNFQRAFPKKTFSDTAYTRGFAQAKSVSQQLSSNPWQELGPFNSPGANFPNPRTNAATAISGRVDSIAVDPMTCTGNRCDTIYLGAAGGGVWKTTDGGATWKPLLDDQPSLTVGAILLDPQNPNIVYVGTGDPSHGGGSHHGIGLLQSMDGGQTWNLLGQDQFQDRAITSIAIDPRTAGGSNATLYLSTTRAQSGGGPTGGGESSSNPVLPTRGVYSTTDGGQTWSLLSDIFSGSNLGAESVVVDPNNPDTIYAGFDYQGVFKSTDAGQNWSAANIGLPPGDFSFVDVQLSPSDPQVLYAALDNSKDETGPLAFFRSNDAGDSWQQLGSTPNACDTQCFSNLNFRIDPTNTNVVYVGGTANYGYLFGTDAKCKTFSPLAKQCNATIMKTSNGGQSWADIGENGVHGPVHPDAHAIVVDPTNPNVVYLGCDGGIFQSTDGGLNWTDLNRGLATLEVVGLSTNNYNDLYIGTQDNGSFQYANNSQLWKHVAGGDGGVAAADPVKETISYNTRYGASLYRNELRKGKLHNVNIAAFRGDYDEKHRGNFYEPYAVAPSKPSDLFYGTYRVWRSQLRGGVDGNKNDVTFDSAKDKNDWVPISFDLSCNQVPTNTAITCDTDANAGAGISAVAVSPIDPNVVVAGASNGNVWLTTNALAQVRVNGDCQPRHNRHFYAECDFVSGVTWTRIDQGLPARFPTSIRFSPGSSKILLVTFSGFDESTTANPGHVFGSNDQGQHWIDLTGTTPGHSLPDLPFSDTLINPSNGHIYAAADFGIYASEDHGLTWDRIDAGLPAAPVVQLQYLPLTKKLVVGTYGRGVWQTIAP